MKEQGSITGNYPTLASPLSAYLVTASPTLVNSCTGASVDDFVAKYVGLVKSPDKGGVAFQAEESKANATPPLEFLWVKRWLDPEAEPEESEKSHKIPFLRRNSIVKAAILLADLYRFSASNQVNEAIDEVIDRFDSWLEKGDWDASKEALRKADVNQLRPAVSLSILSMTLVEKKKMEPERSEFVRRIRDKLIADYGPDEAKQNMRGLE